jgi:hypothetical protein
MEPAGKMTNAKLLKTWWPGTELNRRRRQPFQNRGFEYLQRVTSRRGLPLLRRNSCKTETPQV